MIALIAASYISGATGLISALECVQWVAGSGNCSEIVRRRESRRSRNDPHILQDHIGTNIRCDGGDSHVLGAVTGQGYEVVLTASPLSLAADGLYIGPITAFARENRLELGSEEVFF